MGTFCACQELTWRTYNILWELNLKRIGNYGCIMGTKTLHIGTKSYDCESHFGIVSCIMRIVVRYFLKLLLTFNFCQLSDNLPVILRNLTSN